MRFPLPHTGCPHRASHEAGGDLRPIAVYPREIGRKRLRDHHQRVIITVVPRCFRLRHGSAIPGNRRRESIQYT